MASEGNTLHCDFNLGGVQWEDVDVNDEGNATGLFGTAFKEFSSKMLRTICSRLNLKGVKNVKKQDMVDRLIQAYNNWKNYKAMQNRKEDTVPRKQVQCSFCLMNILFSDKFCTRTVGLKATHCFFNLVSRSWERIP